MSKLSSVLDSVLYGDRYNGKSVVVAVFGEDQEVATSLSFLIEANEPLFIISGSEALDYRPDIVVCASNMTRRDIQIVYKLTKELVDVVLIEESLSSNLNRGSTSKIHNNKYKNFTYLDNTSPHIIVYSNYDDVISNINNTYHTVDAESENLISFSISGSEPNDIFEDYVDDFVSGIYPDVDGWDDIESPPF